MTKLIQRAMLRAWPDRRCGGVGATARDACREGAAALRVSSVGQRLTLAHWGSGPCGASPVYAAPT